MTIIAALYAGRVTLTVLPETDAAPSSRRILLLPLTAQTSALCHASPLPFK